MRFTKMHGAGNDYIYVDCFEGPMPERPDRLARDVSDRHFGIGADGLVLICPSDVADARMRMFNADGSEAEMCGNAIRCVAKYLFDHGIRKKQTLEIETGNGVLTLELELNGKLDGGLVDRVRVDMGEPILLPADVPTTLPGNPSVSGGPVVDADLLIDDHHLKVACVSMGNPHCITFVDQLSDHWVLEVGPKLETDPHFPNRINA
ncbi:MAG: diaminopimelate epimerase, partial [Thermoguttaceae bacterium]